MLRPIETAPRTHSVLVYAANDAGDGDYAVAIWYFGDWATTLPVLGEPLSFQPTHWCPLPEQPQHEGSD